MNIVERYRKKPIVIEAIQVTKSNTKQIEGFVGKKLALHFFNEVDFKKKENHIGLFIPTLEGSMLASINDYIIKGVNGEFYPCKPDIFKKTYEKV